MKSLVTIMSLFLGFCRVTSADCTLSEKAATAVVIRSAPILVVDWNGDTFMGYLGVQDKDMGWVAGGYDGTNTYRNFVKSIQTPLSRWQFVINKAELKRLDCGRNPADTVQLCVNSIIANSSYIGRPEFCQSQH